MSTDAVSGSAQLDAVRKYLAGLKPQIRLDYYDLTPAVRSFIRAMLSKSKNGVAVFASLKTLSVVANISRKTAQRMVNGYTTREGREVIGLKAQGIITEIAPANSRERRCATFQVNWDAFSIDPKRMGELERRLQLPLPGMKTPPVPDEPEPQQAQDDRPAQPAARDVLSLPMFPLVQKAVEHGSPPMDKMSIVSGQSGQGLRSKWPGSTDKMSTNLEVLNLSSDLGAETGVPRGVANLAVETGPSVTQKAGGFSRKPEKSAWAKLHPGLMAKLKKQLSLAEEGRAGMNTYGWTPEAIAAERRRVVLLAAQRAGIWDHVAKDLAEESYCAQLRHEIEELSSPEPGISVLDFGLSAEKYAVAVELAREVLALFAARKPCDEARRRLGVCLGTMNADAIDYFLKSIPPAERKDFDA